MNTTYQPLTLEADCLKRWEDNHLFVRKPKSSAPYSIILPPPNVTGSLHMGHAFQDTLMDTLIRYHQMQGFDTHWQMGMDHAGIATQMVVERNLLKEGVSRHDLGREAFVDKIWEWKAESGGRIANQMRRLGAAADWEHSKFTMDPGPVEAVQKVFIELYEQGLIYRGERLVNWDPTLQTAVSDLEVVSEDEKGHLWHIRYPVVGSEEYLTIATTRPETLFGDVAVAVHPDDARYQHLVGKMLTLPFCDREIPVITDNDVLMDFGTGCVKITPAHDFTDNAIGQRHQLPLRNILNPDATLNDSVPKAYQGLDRFVARKQLVQALESAELLVEVEDYTVKIPRCDRTGDIVEPYLTPQWFVKTESLAEPAIKAVQSGDIEFFPKNWENTYFDWMNRIEDWCISRQLWWGHRIPAWYDDQGKVYVGATESAVREQHQLADDLSLTQDTDVLDTWFSSALWPFSSMGWPNDGAMVETFYPTSVLVTGFDIIFFWVARMIMFGLHFMKAPPFKTVYVHGLIQDSQGQKMSKSKGNVLDPIDLIDGIELSDLVEKRTSGLMQPQMAKQIEKRTKSEFKDGIPSFGTDALRFTFCTLASANRHIRFTLPRIEGNRNFCNKLWNAARYVFMQTEAHTITPVQSLSDCTVVDQWLWSRLQDTKKAVKEHLDGYRFDLASSALYDFVWSEYCDWYLELSKPTLNQETVSEADKNATRYTLQQVLYEILALLHPMMPFITDSIWQSLRTVWKAPERSLLERPYPLYQGDWHTPDAVASVELLQSVATAVRSLRGEFGLSPSRAVDIHIRPSDATAQSILTPLIPLLQSVSKISAVHWLTASQEPPVSAAAIAHGTTVYLPIEGLVDKEAELTRIDREVAKLQKEADKAEKKLGNPSYIEKAPEEVVAKEQAKLDDFRDAIAKLSATRLQIERL